MASKKSDLYPQDAEESVLGACLTNVSALYTASEVLKPQDFFLPTHGALFQSMLDMWAEGRHIDAITVPMEYRDLARHCADTVPTATGIASYADIVLGYSRRRRLRLAGETIAKLAVESTSVDEAIGAADAAIADAVRVSDNDQPTKLGELCKEAYKRVEDAVGGIKCCGHPTTMHHLDNMLGGLGPGTFVIIGGSTGTGKTSLMLSILDLMCRDHRALLFSLEMTKQEILDRLLCARASVPITALRTGSLEDRQIDALMDSIPDLAALKLEIDDRAMVLGDIQRKVRRATCLTPVELIAVDYLQLVSTGDSFESSTAEVTAISRALKLMARDHGACVIGLSQLSRPSAEERTKKPELRRLRQSGALEQDADVVLFIHQDQDRMGEVVKEIIVAKNRNGPTGSFKVRWEPLWAHFEDDMFLS